MVTVNSFEEFAAYEGKELGVSNWIELSQERINVFADATDDHQWIHVDTEKAKAESPFGQTIAHGYLTISMVPHMWNEIIEVNNLERMMNYGIKEMRFAQPKTDVHFVIEIKETGKKAVEGISTFVYYFKK